MSTAARPFVAGMLAIVVVSVLAGMAVGAPAADLGAMATGAEGARQANAPPVAAFDFSPANPEPGETVVLNASASTDPDGEIETYRWDFEDDGEIDAEGGPNRRLAFPAAGTYTVGLTVVDNDGATNSTTRDIVVVGDQPPVAQLNVSPTEVTPGETVTLDATGSSDPDGRIVEWAFDTDGDGTFDRTFDTPATLQIGFGQGGSYDVTLRVTDSDGLTATTAATVTVESTSPTPTEPAGDRTPTASPAGGAGPPAPGGGGVLSTLDRSLPGGRLAAGLILGLLFGLFFVGGVIVYRRPDLAGPVGAAAAGPVGSFVLALLLVGVLVGVPVVAIWARFVTGAGVGSELAFALLELGGLALLSVLLLVLALVQFSDDREGWAGRAEAVSSLSVDEFRWVVFAFGFLATVLLTVGLAALFLALDAPLLVDVAAGLMVATIATVPLALASVLVLMARRRS